MADPRARILITADDRATAVLRNLEGRISAVGNVARRVFGPLAAAAAGVSFLETVRSVEVLKASLETVTGSAAAAEAAFADLDKFATKTPFSVQEVTQAFVRLQALGLNPTIELLTSFGNTASAFGTSLMQYSEAVADAITGEFERLKEFGIRASTAGDNVSFTFKGVTTTVRKSADEIKEYLENIGNSDFAGAMVRRAETLDGAVSNMVDSFGRLMVAIGDVGLTKAINVLASSLGLVAEFLANGAKDAQALARAISAINGPSARLNALMETRLALELRLQEIASRPGGSLGSEYERVSNLLDVYNREIRELRAVIKEMEDGLGDEGGKPTPPRTIRITGGTTMPGLADKELKELQKLIDKLDPLAAKTREYMENVDLLNNAWVQGEISGERYEALMMKLASSTEPVKDEFEDLRQAIEGWGKDFADTLLDSEGNFSSFVDTILRQLARIALAKTFDPAFSAFGDWLSGSVGSLFSASAATVSGPFANGGVFPSVAGYSNQVVNHPTLFKFADGGAIGLMGEAGAEAVMPLARDASGRLGVKAYDMAGNVTVNVINNANGTQATTRERNENGTRVIDVMVEQVKNSIAGDISRGAGSIPAALSGTYGLNRVAGAY